MEETGPELDLEIYVVSFNNSYKLQKKKYILMPSWSPFSIQNQLQFVISYQSQYLKEEGNFSITDNDKYESKNF